MRVSTRFLTSASRGATANARGYPQGLYGSVMLGVISRLSSIEALELLDEVRAAALVQ